MSAGAVVFAYHDVGVRCLSVLLAHGVHIPLVVTHRDDPKENIWFGSVGKLARENGIEVVQPEDPAEVKDFISRLAPDFIFSFYYRHMLPRELLATARRGAFNMHGSLLPKYRGRVPINWAVLKGERETGATLHEMTEKPDAGRIVDRMAVPILPDDVALDVFRKVTVAAEVVLDRALPQLLAGTATLTAQAPGEGSYFGGRKPEDGRIDWNLGARAIHDLVRAVAPPYPGAFTSLAGARVRLLRTRVVADATRPGAPVLNLDAEGHLLVDCADGGRLRVLECDVEGAPLEAEAFRKRFGPGPHRLEATLISSDSTLP
jgi:methionyl-tRNA formyltransferase